MTLERLLHTTAGLLAITLYACGGGESKPAADPAANAADVAAEPASQPAADPGQSPLTVADIDRWDKGMAGELEAVHGAIARLKQAKTSDDTVNAMMALQDMATVEAGAKAAGVDQDRYQLIRTNLSSAASYLAPHIGGLDPSKLSAEQRAEMKRSDAAQLEQMKDVVPPDVVAALTPRAAELRTKDVELTLARVKGSGM
jgi:hypothetical protein